ncbi:MAG: hypothetical protein AAF488_19115, partial [Planctomycetota bacterium]
IGVALGVVDEVGASRILEVAGTSKHYDGLWRSVAGYQPPTEGMPLPELREAHAAPDLARAMAHLDRSYDRILEIEAAGWVTPTDHPDVEPAHEAWLFWEAVREANRTLPSDADSGLRQEFDHAEAAAEAFRDAWNTATPNPAGLSRSWTAVKADCRTCHGAHRDR